MILQLVSACRWVWSGPKGSWEPGGARSYDLGKKGPRGPGAGVFLLVSGPKSQGGWLRGPEVSQS